MTVRREKRRVAGVKKRLCLVLACVAAVSAGCGQNQEAAQWRPEDVELLEPVGITVSYETAARRNLYNAQTFFAQVCPYIEEYQLERSYVFDRYGALPGNQVKKGDALLHANNTVLDDQIESLQVSIADMDEEYQKFLEEDREARKEPLENQRVYGKALENLEKVRPEEGSPEYDEWYYKAYGYRDCASRYRQANQRLMELDEALKERTELYELDRAYNLLCLKRLREDKEASTLKSGMNGYVAGWGSGGSSYWQSSSDILYRGDTASSRVPLVAVCDPSRLEIRSQYLAKSAYESAEDVYAIVGGKRYEVEYTPVESAEEYKRLEAKSGGTVYGVYYPIGDTQDIQSGDYAVIVVVQSVRENVVTISRDALVRDGRDFYTYVLQGDGYVYTKVDVGMDDGMYVEILSGLEEGDKVRTEPAKAVTAGENTVRVTRGRLGSEIQTRGLMLYPDTEWVTNPVKYGTCYFVENYAYSQQAVKKGDILAVVRVVPDQIEIERNEMRLQRARERLQDLINENREENADAIQARQETIQDLEELLADMKADAVTTEIRAPKDGIIRSVPTPWNYTENTILRPGEQLYQITDPKILYLAVDNTDNQLTYGNKVAVEYEDRKNYAVHMATGEVVTAGGMSLSGSMYDGKVLVRLAEEDIVAIAEAVEEGYRLEQDGYGFSYVPISSFKVTAQVRVMEDVLLVPKTAVTIVGNNYYVKVKLDNGEVLYQSFLSGGSDKDNYWVIEGLTEGMELCLD